MNNSVQLLGNLGRDAEIHFTQSGNPRVTFSVATDRFFRDSQGETQKRTDWHRVVLFGKLAGALGEHLTKGKQVFVSGRLQTRKWEDRDGNARYITEVVGNQVRLLGSPPSREESEQAA